MWLPLLKEPSLKLPMLDEPKLDWRGGQEGGAGGVC